MLGTARHGLNPIPAYAVARVARAQAEAPCRGVPAASAPHGAIQSTTATAIAQLYHRGRWRSSQC